MLPHISVVLALWAFNGRAIASNATCTNLSTLRLSDVSGSINFATPIANGSSFTGNTSESSYNAVQTDLPASCRVSFTVATGSNSSAGAEVWLPSGWTGRYLTVGNGGFAGGVNYPDLVWGLRKGFAVMSTDTGHHSSESDGSWLSNAEEAIDWGHRGT
jgi:feruloyl esterase